ncbi:MAG: PH domain-containing protein [candidate division KSB1 bacterium]|nr:PH domain-containing protein [candidate division KSB1 bacterium]
MGYVETLLAHNETIVFKTRQHWIVLARSMFLNGAFLILIILLAIAASAMLGPAGLIATLLFIIPVIVFGVDYLKWWNEEYIITNRRVIQVEGIINKHVIDSSLEKVNDVVLRQSFLGRLLDYGDIDILTASEMGINALHKIKHPIKFKTEMLDQKLSFGSEERTGLPGGQTDIPALIAELDHLRKQGVLTDAEFQDKKTQLLAKLE